MSSALDARDGFGIDADPLRDHLLCPSQLFAPPGQVAPQSLRQTGGFFLLDRHRVVLSLNKNDGHWTIETGVLMWF
jgi:hypothetical protein